MRMVPGIDGGYVQRSTDGGETWDSPNFFLPLAQYKTWPTLIRPLRDGRLVLMAGVWSRDNPNPYPNPNMEKMMFISTDQGQSWGEPISLMPVSTGVCEESDFVELPTGDLMWIHRAEHSSAASNRMISYSTLTGDTFVSQPATDLSWPHSGAPNVLMTDEGVILDLATTGSHWSSDNGLTWQDLMVDGETLKSYYYPRAVQTADGLIMVAGHRGDDNTYGGVDQAIMLQTFRLEPPGPPEVTLGLVDNGSPDTGLHSYTLTATGPGITTLSEFTIDGEVHQVLNSEGNPSEWLGDGSASAWETTDSHVIFGDLRLPDLGGEGWDYDNYPKGPPAKVTRETIIGGGDSGMGTLNNYDDSVIPISDAYLKTGAPSAMYETVELMQLVVADGNGLSINLTVLTATDYNSSTGRFTLTTHDLSWSSAALTAGDANGDGFVDSADASILAQHWLQEFGATWADGDFNRDGAVNDIDATILAANWQSHLANVPEPSTLVLLAGMLLLGLLRCKVPRPF